MCICTTLPGSTYRGTHTPHAFFYRFFAGFFFLEALLLLLLLFLPAKRRSLGADIHKEAIREALLGRFYLRVVEFGGGLRLRVRLRRLCDTPPKALLGRF